MTEPELTDTDLSEINRIFEEHVDVTELILWTQDIIDLDVDTLDQLALLHFADDPEVEIDYIGLEQDAGVEGHGVNTEEEMMVTWSDHAEPITD